MAKKRLNPFIQDLTDEEYEKYIKYTLVEDMLLDMAEGFSHFDNNYTDYQKYVEKSKKLFKTFVDKPRNK